MSLTSPDPSSAHGSQPVLLPSRKSESVEILPPSDLHAIHVGLQRLNDKQVEFSSQLNELKSDFKIMQSQVGRLETSADGFRKEIRAEFSEFRRETKQENEHFRRETKQENENFRRETKQENEQFRREMKAENEQFRKDVRADFNELRKELRAEFRQCSEELLSRVDDRISSRLFKWVGGATLSSGALGAIILKMLH